MRARLRVRLVFEAIIASAIRPLLVLLRSMRFIVIVSPLLMLLMLRVEAAWLCALCRIIFQCCFVVVAASSHVLR